VPQDAKNTTSSSYAGINCAFGTFKLLVISITWRKSEIHKVDDIGDIVDEDFDGCRKLEDFKGEIVAVISNEAYNSCQNCNAKIIAIWVNSKCVTKIMVLRSAKISISM